ncbi:MAG: L,D-transpeptidase family protein [Firmicutes bacterium]|nr:L,D-transpeptidase family protein [Bacillota bacterium]
MAHPARSGWGLAVSAGIGLAVLAAAAGWYYGHGFPASRPLPAASRPARVHRARPRPVPPALTVTVSPASGTVWGRLAEPITLHFSQPVAADGFRPPALSPAVPGRWVRVSARTWSFEPQQPWYPLSVVRLRLAAGVQAVNGAHLPRAVQARWAAPPGSDLTLDEALARLGYLPVSFTPAVPWPQGTAAWLAVLRHPLPGSFSWAYPDIPAQLAGLWQPGSANVLLRGAVMAFERQHGLPTDGVAGPAVWQALVAALAAGQTNPDGYTYVLVQETLPETLYLWHDGQVVLTSLANTGIPQSPTLLGTFPIYLRYRSQDMRGVNPWGQPYNDPGVPFVNYFAEADAIHGFVRARYGFPQSLGCVELPVPEAAAVWPYLHIGTLVTVLPPGTPAGLPGAPPPGGTAPGASQSSSGSGTASGSGGGSTPVPPPPPPPPGGGVPSNTTG